VFYTHTHRLPLSLSLCHTLSHNLKSIMVKNDEFEITLRRYLLAHNFLSVNKFAVFKNDL